LTCGVSARFHISRNKKKTKRKETYHAWRPGTIDQGIPPEACGFCGLSKSKHGGNWTYLGIDGEGQGKWPDPHRYVFLACSNEKGDRRWAVRAKKGERLTSEECLDFILSLPQKHTRIFAYSFQYDLTKILTDIPNRDIFLLYRPELRQRPAEQARLGPYPIRWRGYRLNLQASKFTVQRGKSKVVVWDIFKFFQGKFVSALEDWKIGDEKLLSEMSRMKDQRGEFDRLDPQSVEDYCFGECSAMAALARKLTEAHIQAGLYLKNYYGAGSSAAAMLTVMGIKEKIQKPPDRVSEIASMAFFGGRFENSVLGAIPQACYGYDISSAYPYELCFLPCLLHGKWEWTKVREKLDESDVVQALVRYRLGGCRDEKPWGPFPFRDVDGNICYPIESGGGWVYLHEYLQGEKLFRNVHFKEAWVYRTQCDCKPFEKIPGYYLERLRIGKEGPGIVIKLGCNSCYGKLAQSVGKAQFNSWLWAGMITSGSRAKLLELLGLHKNWWNLYMMATDGIVTRERLTTPLPKDTGTFEAHKPEKPTEKLPLGGWEEKAIPKGMFFARPGIYFPLNPDAKNKKEASSVRGRGVGRKVVLDQWKTIVETYERLDPEELSSTIVPITSVSRFCGAKTSISVSVRNGEKHFTRASANDGVLPSYGEWIVRKVEMSFDPRPKRQVTLGGRIGESAHALLVRKMGRRQMSSAYKRALSQEAIELKEATQEVLEQPDGDLADYL